MDNITPEQSATATPELPDDVLHLICEQLGAQKQFATLYRCALSSHRFSEPALKTLYRLHNDYPTVAGKDMAELLREKRPDDAPTTFGHQEAARDVIIKKWALLWKSILRSTLGKTYRPYSHFIRVLDLQDLETLLEDNKFRGNIERSFFSGDLAPFNIRMDSPFARDKRGKPIKILDNVSILNAIGEAITGKAHLLEELRGHKIIPGRLQSWVSPLPRLVDLRIWSGEALQASAGQAIRENCPHFRRLTIFAWLDRSADTLLGEFLTELPDNSLQCLEIIGRSYIAGKSFEALSTRHGASLQKLKLSGLDEDAIKSLDKLSACTSLRTLLLEDSTPGNAIRLEETQNDVYLAVIRWISSCESLKRIYFKTLNDAPSILAAVLDSSVGKPPPPLTHLNIDGYQAHHQSAANFHSSLPILSETLTKLELKADGDDAMPAHLDILVNSIGRLPLLRKLYLKDLSNNFTDDLIINLVLSLPNLIDFWTSGTDITDAVLPVLSTLNNLKNLHMYAMTRFTYDGIMNFVNSLRIESDDGKGDGNRGLSFNVMNAEGASVLTETEQSNIRERMDEKVGGRFDFTLYRDPEDSEFDEDSD